jgi:effector-binding domain-containing protein
MEVVEVDLEPQVVVGLREVVALQDLTPFFERAFTAVDAELTREALSPAGPWLAIYRGVPTDAVDVTAGVSVGRPITPSGGLDVVTLPGGAAVQALHVGPYDQLATTYGELERWLGDRSLQAGPVMWEEYLVGPDTEPDASRWQTRIVQPVS